MSNPRTKIGQWFSAPSAPRRTLLHEVKFLRETVIRDRTFAAGELLRCSCYLADCLEAAGAARRTTPGIAQPDQPARPPALVASDGEAARPLGDHFAGRHRRRERRRNGNGG